MAYPYSDFNKDVTYQIENLVENLGEGTHKVYNGIIVNITNNMITVPTKIDSSGNYDQILCLTPLTDSWSVWEGKYVASPVYNKYLADGYVLSILQALKGARKQRLFDKISKRPEYKLVAKLKRLFK